MSVQDTPPAASEADDTRARLSGLAQLRALAAAGGQPAMAATLGFDFAEIEEGRVAFAGTPGPHLYNPLGTIHGGYAATLLDSACGCAVHSRLAPGQAYATLEIKIAYHRAMTAETGLVRAEGTVISFGRHTAFAEARLTDASGRVYATATSTLLIMSA